MAKAAALPDDAQPAKSGPSMIIQIAVLLLMTGVATGMGFVSAGFIAPPPPAAEAADEAAAEAAHGPEAGAHGKEEAGHGEEAEGEEPVSALPHAVMLPSITTNLASPSDIWVRMELAIVYDGPPDPVTTEAIHQDLLAFMRTVKMHQIEGASGFQHLRADIEDRIRTRSEGKVTRVLIRTLLFE